MSPTHFLFSPPTPRQHQAALERILIDPQLNLSSRCPIYINDRPHSQWLTLGWSQQSQSPESLNRQWYCQPPQLHDILAITTEKFLVSLLLFQFHTLLWEFIVADRPTDKSCPITANNILVKCNVLPFFRELFYPVWRTAPHVARSFLHTICPIQHNLGTKLIDYVCMVEYAGTGQ